MIFPLETKTCPICLKMYDDPENTDLIASSGRCVACDHVEYEVNEDYNVNELPMDLFDCYY